MPHIGSLSSLSSLSSSLSISSLIIKDVTDNDEDQITELKSLPHSFKLQRSKSLPSMQSLEFPARFLSTFGGTRKQEDKPVHIKLTLVPPSSSNTSSKQINSSRKSIKQNNTQKKVPDAPYLFSTIKIKCLDIPTL